MDLTHSFRVPVPIEQAWAVLTDLERIAPCMPGASLDSVEDGQHRGGVRVKVGPITATYRGEAHFLERDDETYVAILRATGREARGQGNATATITARLQAAGDATVVDVVTELAITGKAAQFGRGVLAEVSSKLLDQFVDRLESMLASDASGAGPADLPSAVRIGEPESSASEPRPDADDAVDLLSTTIGPIARRVAPPVAILVLGWWLLSRRRSGG